MLNLLVVLQNASGWSAVSLLIISIFVIYVFNVIKTNRKTNVPGPWGLPLLGYLPFLTQAPYIKLQQLRKKYGDVFRITLLGDISIILDSYEAIKEAFVTRGLEFSGVPDKFSFVHWLSDSTGIFSSEGEEWNQHRRFLLQTFRELGMGKHTLAERVQDISQDLLEHFRSHAGAPFDPFNTISNCVVNVICAILFNKHYNQNDPEFVAIRDSSKDIAKAAAGIEFLLAKGKLFYLSSLHRRFAPTKNTLHNVIKKLINEHKENLDELNPQDYLDMCLIEIRKTASKGKNSKQYHTERHIIGNCVTVFMAAIETTTATLYWFLKFMMVFPEVQKKIQKELDNVVGRQRMPQWSDRTSLPYTEAVMEEMQRMASVIPMGLLKCTLEDTELRGFRISRRSHVIANFWAANTDAKYWPNPEKFKPERFLDTNGKFVSREAAIPFSIGKRSCAGESVARMELFIFFTTALHQFSICPPDGVVPNLEPRNSIVRAPPPYEIRAVLRP